SRSSRSNAMKSARTSAGISSATKRRKNLRSFGCGLIAVQEMDAHKIQGELRGLEADHLAVAWKARISLPEAIGTSERDEDGANRFFLAAAAGPGDARDSDSQSAAHAAPNALRQSCGHFATDRASCLNQFRRDIGPGGLQFIAIANSAAQKVGR